MPIQQHWNIKSRSRSCCDTEREFTQDETFFTAIFEDPEHEDGFLRKDYSVKAWDRLSPNLEPFSFWRSKYEAPPPPENREVVAKETAESLLRRLIEEDDPGSENARYVLAVMLERKKQLVQVDAKEKKSGKFLIYERKGTGEAFIVKDPRLRLDQLEAVQEEVSELLGGGPPATVAASAQDAQ